MGARTESHRAVTVACGRRRLDVALPAAVPVTDLLPALLRLVDADPAPGPDRRWALSPIGRPALGAADTLDLAGVLVGEVLILSPVAAATSAPPASLRDQVEDLVQVLDRAWTARTSARFLLWTTTAGAALLAPASCLIDGAVIALQVTVALLLTATAMAVSRVEKTGAATCLAVACGWAALAGWAASAASGPVAGSVGAAVAALLTAGLAVPLYPGAAGHCAAFAVATAGAGAAAIAVAAGAPPTQVAIALALAAVLVIGVVPRVALAVTGVATAGAPDPARPSAGEPGPFGAGLPASRFTLADRVLTGSLIGLSLVALIAAIPAAVAGDVGNRLFAAGIGLLLLLRSRVFSQVPHLLAERVAGVLLLGAVGVGWYLTNPGALGLLLLLPITAGAAAAAVAGLGRHAWPLGQSGAGPLGQSGAVSSGAAAVSRARAARLLDLAEQLLVVAVVVFASGLLGLFDWIAVALG